MLNIMILIKKTILCYFENRMKNIGFYALRFKAGFNSWEKCAEFCGVTVRTIKNWERTGAPITAIKLMSLMSRDLSHFGENW